MARWTLDVPAAATTLLALYAIQLWVAQGSMRDAVVLGLCDWIGVRLQAVGHAVSADRHGHACRAQRRLPARLAERARRPDPLLAVSPRRAAPLLIAALIAMTCLAVAYGGRFAYYSDAQHHANATLNYIFGNSGWLHDLVYELAARVPLPAGLRPFVEGIRAVLWHNEIGHVSYLLGHVASHGWWYFYPVALAVKTPIPMLLTGPPGLFLLAREGWRDRDTWRLAPLALGVTLLTFASLYSHINIGIRHVLILYPFLAFGSAHVLAVAWRRLRDLPNRDWAGVGSALVVLLAGWQISTLATANPDYLPYFNEAVADPEKVLVDSDLAWGQDLRRLEHRLAELKVHSFSFAYLGTADLKRETFPALTRLPPGHPTTGWVAITALARVHAQAGYAWLDAYAPVERIGKSIDLYFIPETP